MLAYVTTTVELVLADLQHLGWDLVGTATAGEVLRVNGPGLAEGEEEGGGGGDETYSIASPSNYC